MDFNGFGRNGIGTMAPQKNSTSDVKNIRTPCGETVKKLIIYTSIQNAIVTPSPKASVNINTINVSMFFGSVILKGSGSINATIRIGIHRSSALEILVAAFFATTIYDYLTDTYKPIMHTVSKGVVYYSPMGCMVEGLEPDPRMLPIGMEALHRPGEQRGYGYSMKENENLNDVKTIQKYFFWHTPAASKKIQILTKGMKTFFPYDPMTEKVRNILKYRIYSDEALLQAYAKMPNFAINMNDARSKMIAGGCKFVNYVPFAYTQQELEFIRKELHQMYPDSY